MSGSDKRPDNPCGQPPCISVVLGLSSSFLLAHWYLLPRPEAEDRYRVSLSR